MVANKGRLSMRPVLAAGRINWISKLKDGTPVTETLEITRRPKTYQQVKMIFGLMIKDTLEQAAEKNIGVEELLVYLIDHHIPKGQELTEDFLHELAYVICPTTDDEGRRVTLSKMNTEQAARLFESFRNIVAGIGIVIPDPNPEWRHLSEI